MRIKDPAYNYENPEHEYSAVRKADPRIAAYVHAGLRGMSTVINIGAGTGSYEPDDKYVIAVEPSENMRKKRLESGRHPAVSARAESLPFDSKSFDASLTILTIHHWQDLESGLRELKRVAAKRIVILTYDPAKLGVFWNAEYFPMVVEAEKNRYPELSKLESIIGIKPEIRNIKIPFDCTDGFQEAFYGRPEKFLKKKVRKSQSAWSFISEELEEQYTDRLRTELLNGEWDKKYGFHRKMKEFEGAYKMLEFDLTGSQR